MRSDKPVFSFDSSDGWVPPPDLSPDGQHVAWAVRSADNDTGHLTVRRVADGAEILRYPRGGEKLVPTLKMRIMSIQSSL